MSAQPCPSIGRAVEVPPDFRALGPKPLSLRRNFSWTFAGNLAYAACQWGMLVVLARLGTPEMVGQFALGLAITAPIVMFGNLQLRAVQATDARGEFPFGVYVSLRLITTVLSMGLIAAVAFGSGYRGETALVILVLGAAKCVESLSDNFFGLLQKHEQFRRVGSSLILKSLVSLPAMALAIHHTGSVLAGAAALAGSWALLLVLHDAPNGRRVLRLDDERMRPVGDLRRIARLARIALPLGVVTLVGSLSVNIPRYFMASLGAEPLGIYAALAYTQVVGARLLLSVCNACEPRQARCFARGDVPGFRAIQRNLLIVASAVGALGVLASLLAGDTILGLLYGQRYRPYQREFTVVMVGSGLSYLAMVYKQAVTSSRRFKSQLIPTGASLILIIGFSSCLVPSFGIGGAAAATGLGALAELVGYRWLFGRVMSRAN